MSASRIHNSVRNIRINLLFYLLTVLFGFVSRKIFLDYLSADFVGLTGTLGNILGFINIAECGISAAIGFALYKPLYQEDRESINHIVTLFACLYKRVGAFVLTAGVIVSLFIPLIFRESDFSLLLIFSCFYAFLLSSLLGYFFNYKQVLLAANQKGYVVSIYFNTTRLCKVALQMYVTWEFGNLYLWIAVELVAAVVQTVLLQHSISKNYPWLTESKLSYEELKKRYPDVLIRARQVFLHQLKQFFLTQSDQIMIYAFVSLSMVAYYGNYTMIVSALTALFISSFGGIGASVGNLIAENQRNQIRRVFWEFMALRYLITGVVVFACLFYLEPLVIVWLGDEYVLDSSILYLLTGTVFISTSRGAVDTFNSAYGLYDDVWSAWTEAAINLTVSVLCAWHWGVAGLLMGKLASLVPIALFWKPYYLYHRGFHEPVLLYWLGNLKLLFCLVLGLVAAYFIKLGIDHIMPRADISYGSLLLNGAAAGSLYLAVYTALLYSVSLGFRNLCVRGWRLILRRS